MSKINAYISFNGKCREAMNFYKECIGGELEFMTFADSPMTEQTSGSDKDKIMHSSLKKGNLLLMASDMGNPDGYKYGNNISLTLTCESEEEINNLFTKLSDGGEILMPLGIQFWGDLFGAFYDKFKIKWMLLYDTNKK